MKVCFVSFFAYPLFDPSASGGIGGAEVRAVTFAKGFAQLTDHEVSFVVGTDCPRAPCRCGEITLYFDVHRLLPRGPYRAWSPDLCWKIPYATSQRLVNSVRKRFGCPRPHLSKLYGALDTEVVCCFGVSNQSAGVIRSARQAGKKTILLLASDGDLDESYFKGSRIKGPYRQNGHLCHYALTNADRIVVQTRHQKERLSVRFGRASTLIRNPILIDRHPGADQLRRGERFVLWIGRTDAAKRPDQCLKLAERCPHVPILMIMNETGDGTFGSLVRRATRNIRLIEKVSFDQIEGYFAAASVLINTSDVEGFPNAFLQAAKYGVPILSLHVDPDGMLSRHGCGVAVNGDLNKMAERLGRMWDGGPEYQRMSRAGPAYVRAYHDVAGRVAELESLIRDLCASPEGRRRCA